MFSGTKTAVVNLVQASAGLAIGHNIRVNAILPGMVNTQFIGRTGDGLKPAEWLGPGARGDNNADTRANRRGVLTLISDDDRAGECLIVDNPQVMEGRPK